jgi:SAM-dependent methyltransferase
MFNKCRIKRFKYGIRALLRNESFAGYCVVCASRTIFVPVGNVYRDDLKCIKCRSSSRHRAIIHYLVNNFADLEILKLHELSPYGEVSRKISSLCGEYSCSHYFPDEPGKQVNGFSNENVESLSFPNDRFDIVVSQDVFEHVANPAQGFAEVARVLKSGGSHVFTIPWRSDSATVSRVKYENGVPIFLEPPVFHGAPFSRVGSLVITDFGRDVLEHISRSSDMKTTVVKLDAQSFGIKDSIEIFHSTKPCSRNSTHIPMF